MYKVVRDLTGRASNATVPIKSSCGRTLITKSEQNNKWMENFQEVLNQPNLGTMYNLFGAREININTNIWMDYISEAEVWAGIVLLKNKTVPGIDTILLQLLKYRHDAIVYQLV